MVKIIRIFPPIVALYNGALANPELVNADVVIKTESIMLYFVKVILLVG